MRSMLSRLGLILGSRPPPSGALMSGIEHLVNAFFHLGEDLFVGAVSSLPSDPQLSIKGLLTSTGICIEIEDRVACHLRGDK